MSNGKANTGNEMQIYKICILPFGNRIYYELAREERKKSTYLPPGKKIEAKNLNVRGTVASIFILADIVFKQQFRLINFK